MSWKTPKCDWSGSDFFNISTDLNLIEEDIEYFYLKYKNAYVLPEYAAKINWGYNDIPKYSDIQRIVDGLNILIDKFKIQNIKNIDYIEYLFFDNLNEIGTALKEIKKIMN